MNDFSEPIYYSVPVLTAKTAITIEKVENVNVLWVKLSAYESQFDGFTEELNQFYQHQGKFRKHF
jgi:hypothetical protein